MKKLKQFFRFFNMFELDLNSRSYKSPIIRIIVSALVMLAVWVLRLSVTITDVTTNIILSVLLLAVMVMCVLCFFIAAVECLQVGDNRKKDQERKNDTK